jgi:hypothetical protein
MGTLAYMDCGSGVRTHGTSSKKDQIMGRQKERTKSDLLRQATEESVPWNESRVTVKWQELSAYSKHRYGVAVGDDTMREWVEKGKVLSDGSRVYMPMHMISATRCFYKTDFHKFMEAESDLATAKSSAPADKYKNMIGQRSRNMVGRPHLNRQPEDPTAA